MYYRKSSLVLSMISYLLIPNAACHTLLSGLTFFVTDLILKILSIRFLKGSRKDLNPFLFTLLIFCFKFSYATDTVCFKSATELIEEIVSFAVER